MANTRLRANRLRGTFVLYVEGPRDRDILRGWAARIVPAMARALADTAVILGGRQPDRAVSHFRRIRADAPAARAVCVLDRDRDAGANALPAVEPGLEFFVWGRRHIESYLLVPDAIRRSLRLPSEDRRIERACRRMLPPPGNENLFQDFDAKRLLAEEGELARAVGRPLRPGRIARAMRESDLHPDIRVLFDRVRAAVAAT